MSVALVIHNPRTERCSCEASHEYVLARRTVNFVLTRWILTRNVVSHTDVSQGSSYWIFYIRHS